jgi:hypothetical protein
MFIDSWTLETASQDQDYFQVEVMYLALDGFLLLARKAISKEGFCSKGSREYSVHNFHLVGKGKIIWPFPIISKGNSLAWCCMPKIPSYRK